MQKVITINDKDITLSNNNAWLFIYSDQFGHDIVETIMPVLSAGLQIVGGIVDELGDTRDVDLRDVVKIYNSGAMQDAIVYLMTLRVTDLINIVWSMAKAADDTIRPPKQWARDLEEFPVDEIVPVVADLLVSGMVSKKNRGRLREMVATLKPEK